MSKITFNDKTLSNIYLDTYELKNSIIKSAKIPENTDLVKGIYEGGIKIWECSIDLLNFLPTIYENINLNNENILELGCGHGLPGIYLLLKGGNVTFQDFNKEVLDIITKGYLNQLKEKFNLDLFNKSSFENGDWGNFKSDKKYNIIISCDTLYNTDNYEKIYNILKNYLSKNGKVLFATKKFYFGVGGSSSEFMYFIREKGEFEVNKIKEINDGISNLRLIVEIKWK
jgi:SAM-dependent methyltransferase